MAKKHRNKQRQQDPKVTPSTSIQQNHNNQPASKLIEPQSNYYDRLLSKPDVIIKAFNLHEEEIRINNLENVPSILENNLQCQRYSKWLGVKCHGTTLFAASPNGILFSYDGENSKVCWSIPTGKPLHVSYQSSENDGSSIVILGESRRVYIHTKESKLKDLKCHASELVADPCKYLDGVFVKSILETEFYVNLRTGEFVSPRNTDTSDEILRITRFDYQLTCYKPGANIVLWYRRVASFDISIVSSDGTTLDEKNDVHARQREYLVTPVGNITWCGNGTFKDGKDKIPVGGHDLGIDVIRIEKRQIDYNVIKEDVGIVSAVSNVNLNIRKVYDVVSYPNFYEVSTERCSLGLRDFILSSRKDDHKMLVKLISGMVTGMVRLHDKGIFLRNLDVDAIFVDADYNAQISIISTKTIFPLKSSSMGAKDMLDLGRIIFFCFTHAEYGGENLYGPKPKEHLKPIYDCPDALDLLKKLFDKNPEKRATALQASVHTLFWPLDKNLRFIRDVTDHLELPGSPKLAIDAIVPIGSGKIWKDSLPSQFLAVMKDENYGSVTKDGSGINKIHYYSCSTFSLLRIIRDLLTHETKIRGQVKKFRGDEELREMFGSAGFGSYFREKYPKLVNQVYNVMKQRLENKTIFLEYYKQSPL